MVFAFETVGERRDSCHEQLHDRRGERDMGRSAEQLGFEPQLSHFATTGSARERLQTRVCAENQSG